MTVRPVPFASPEYDHTVRLRRDVLRRPLGLDFTLEELAREEDDVHLALFDGESLLACLILSPQGEALKMRQVAVREDRQGSGLGRFLVEAAERWAVENGFTTMTLHARETAVPFYTHLGYTVEGRPFAEVGLPHRAMAKGLGEASEEGSP